MVKGANYKIEIWLDAHEKITDEILKGSGMYEDDFYGRVLKVKVKKLRG